MLSQQKSSALAPTAVNLKHWRQPITSRENAAVAPGQRSTESTFALPSLEAALDNQTMTAYLRPRLPLPAQTPNMSVSSSHLLDCKPGQRALVRYELTTPGRRAKTVVFGKIYSETAQLVRVDQIMDTLWHDVFSGDNTCGMPQPLGLIPELAMQLYLPAEGEFLDTSLAGQQAGHAMAMTARWLGTLHSHRLQLAKHFDLANELKNLADWARLVGQTYPDLAALADELLSTLQRQAQSISIATETPIHKDFHYRHVLVGHGVKVIDFDEVRLGDPNFDLAHFCANLHLLAYRQHGSPHHFHELEHRFLHTYSRHVGQTWATFARANQAQFRFFYRYTCIKLARQLALGFGPSPIPTADQRHRQVQMILEQGNVS